MKKIFLLLLIMSQVFASTKLDNFFMSNHAQKLCEQAQRVNGARIYRQLRAIYTNQAEIVFLYRMPNNYLLKLINLNSNTTRELEADEEIIDVIIQDQTLYALGMKSIYEFDLLNLVLLKRYKIHNAQITKYQRPYQFTLKNNLFYIAFGELGIKVFDKAQNQVSSIYKPVLDNKPGHISLVSGVTVLGDDLVSAYDNLTLGNNRGDRAFEGVVLKNLITGTEKQLRINQRAEAYHLPYMVRDGEDLYVNNLELYFAQDLERMWSRRGALKPDFRHYSFRPGHLIGKALIHDKVMYGCFRDRGDYKVMHAGIHQLK